jgi:hypothetical protein
LASNRANRRLENKSYAG